MKKVLIVVDMQKDFIDGALGSKEAEAIVGNVVKKIQEFDGSQIVVTQDTHYYSTYMETQEGRMLPVLHCIYGTEGWKVSKEVEDAISTSNAMSFYIEKETFGSTKLAHVWGAHELVDNGAHMEFILIGLCTDICVISNAMLLKTYYPEAHIIVDASCCAGVTLESHKNALEAMKMCQIDIINE